MGSARPPSTTPQDSGRDSYTFYGNVYSLPWSNAAALAPRAQGHADTLRAASSRWRGHAPAN
ncbi:MAG: hypothetical protein ABIO37_16870 [Caulobacteraceae bacterium]